MKNKSPYIEVQTSTKSCWEGWNKIADTLNAKIKSLHSRKIIITVECYQGTYEDINLRELKKRIPVNATCTSRDVFKNEEEINRLSEKELSGLPFSAKASINDIEEYFDTNKLAALRQNIDFIEEGVILIFGVGASKICTPDILIYADMSRWEILQRFKRNDVSNVGVSNNNLPFDLQYRWAYFIDWKICDKLKKQLLGQCDYFLETNNWEKPKLATGDIVREALAQSTTQPFFTAPFYDPELWENNTPMQEQKEDEFSWVFNCVAEENNILFKINGFLIEVPSINVIYMEPKKLLGNAVHSHFGSELPIRMVFIDNLDSAQENLHIYPDIDFLKDNFGLSYSQSEVFYIMDTKPGAKLRLGFKKEMNKDHLPELLNKNNSISKTALDKWLNTVNVKKHDHINIPAGLVHSNGNNTMILRISSAPDIFTFKMPDDILNIPDKNLASADAATEKLISPPTPEETINTRFYHQSASDTKEDILSHEGDQLSIKRLWFEDKLHLQTNGGIQVLNLVEGDEAVIESPQNKFAPFFVHFAESFIIPAGIAEYTITPTAKGKRCAVLRISV
ncbi:class I mannose-6-phosphate isomerase [Fulvivirga kasyanovii]|uniref:Mannose-6-phosphate isomerase n=1 Tax=Fulvivirga kasyanovii TaxID=396812 RepID=A0ABW9RWG8_9BACT|nr:hypothetical protein [Fulvivirga kasyanovii]MTI28061.1 hypothetical protein [Fulvivirga kasyanovii]